MMVENMAKKKAEREAENEKQKLDNTQDFEEVKEEVAAFKI